MSFGSSGDAVSAAWLLSAVAFTVAMSATPGPNNVMVAASGATFGFRRTLPHLFGVSLGFPVMLVAVALGAGQALHHWPWLHVAMRWAGILYLGWLAWRIATARVDKGLEGTSAARPFTFLQAALFQWINPKAWVIAAGAIVTYTTEGRAVLAQTLILAALFVAVCVPSLALWTGVGAGIARIMRSPRSIRNFNVCMAALLVASLVPLVWEGVSG